MRLWVLIVKEIESTQWREWGSAGRKRKKKKIKVKFNKSSNYVIIWMSRQWIYRQFMKLPTRLSVNILYIKKLILNEKKKKKS